MISTLGYLLCLGRRDLNFLGSKLKLFFMLFMFLIMLLIMFFLLLKFFFCCNITNVILITTTTDVFFINILFYKFKLFLDGEICSSICFGLLQTKWGNMFIGRWNFNKLLVILHFFWSWNMETTNIWTDIMGVRTNCRWTIWHGVMNIWKIGPGC